MNYLEEIQKKDLKFVKLVDKVSNIFGDNIAEISYYDFSRANLSEESRIEAVTLVAAACYANPNAVGRSTLFDRLAQESLGLPSSSFEFIPILLDSTRTSTILDNYSEYVVTNTAMPSILVFAYYLDLGNNNNNNMDSGRIITNYRALCADYDLMVSNGYEGEDFRLWFNTEEECDVIRVNCHTFLSYIDTNTRTQYIRHRQAAWQEMSRRYVSGKKVPFDFYISKGMQDVHSKFTREYESGAIHYDITTGLLIDLAVEHYKTAISEGVTAQEARRILPQAMYTLVWSSWLPNSLDNFFKLRDDSHAQWEIRELAKAKKKLINYKETK